MVPTQQLPDLAALAERYSLGIEMTLGLGAGVYFEYFRRTAPSPTRYIRGLNRHCESRLGERLKQLAQDKRQAIREALAENALAFNLDRAPTNGLMGVELLAEEFPDLDRFPDWHESIKGIRQEIVSTKGLYRGIYVEFLLACQPYLATGQLAAELGDITKEWHELAEQLETAAADASQLETSGRLLRRLAYREENFWGKILEF